MPLTTPPTRALLPLPMDDGPSAVSRHTGRVMLVLVARSPAWHSRKRGMQRFRSRACQCLLACALAGTTGASAWAAGHELGEATEPIHLEYSAADGCPDQASFEGRVRARTAHARFVTDVGTARTFV